MLLNTLLSCAVLLTGLLATTAEDKWAPRGGCGCRKPSSSSSSSSSSHHPRRCHRKSSSSSSSSSSDCHVAPVCSPCNSRKFVRELMAQQNAWLQAGEFARVKAMANSLASTSVIYPGCESNTCCHTEQSFSDFIDNTFDAGDKLLFFQPEEDNIRMYPNGTVVYSQTVLEVPLETAPGMNVFTYNYYWTPVYGCNFQLTYVDGNSIFCPTYVLDLPACAPCE